jgi:DNA-binding transcriptional MocR family regulator
MLTSLAQHFPPPARWTTPEGGLFTWVTLPEDIDAIEVLRAAVTQKVAFVPGSAFFSDGSGRNCLRLNFSHASADVIDRGIARLGAVITAQLAGATSAHVLEATVS